MKDDVITLQRQPRFNNPTQMDGQTGRNTKGQFTVGNQISRGHSSTCRDNLLAFRRNISADDIAALAETLLEKARAGDIRAIQTLLDYCLPRPATLLQVDDRHQREEEERQRRESLVRAVGRTV